MICSQLLLPIQAMPQVKRRRLVWTSLGNTAAAYARLLFRNHFKDASCLAMLKNPMKFMPNEPHCVSATLPLSCLNL